MILIQWRWYYNKAGSTDPGSVWNCIRCVLDERGEGMSVSYTHLTLPTICSV